MFETIEAAPRDAILGLTAAFREDSRNEKTNLSVGVYQDETGKTPTLECVRAAEQRLAEAPSVKSYLPIPGAPEYAEVVQQQLALGADHEAVTSGRIASAHTPGGTGALRVAGDFINANFPKATLWMSEPTWPNHGNIFDAARVPTKGYAYFDKSSNALDFEPMLEAIQKMPAGDVILLHGCCHNPTGIDPTLEQWKQIADAVYGQGLLPLLDFAYQGFAEGIEEDAAGLREFCRPGAELMVCSSFSKNFGLYRERVGALSIVCPVADVVGAIQSQVNRVIRSNYSNPPAHGAAIVNCILRDESLRTTWEKEVATMRSRINGTRQQFVDALASKNVPGDYSFITQQRGMFSFTGLTKDQVETLREKYAIYIVGSGRINVAGLTPANIERVAEAIGEVVG
ncbi:MAG: aspartate/tyrosine/aromatic aminotransferase [Planctomycetes bacterium]|nr:aspartate/tyrosine/aromatic aminotransferase [Planctomycetota bacterium]